jgi:O-antigen ligase
MDFKNSHMNHSVRLQKICALSIASLLLFSYPLALFIPLGHGMNIFDFALPSILIVTVLASSLLIYFKQWQATPLVSLTWLSSLLIILSGLINHSALSFTLQACGFGLIPLIVAFLCRRSTQVKSIKFIFSRIIALLWLANILHSYSALPSINRIGLTGNQNWFSALLLATLPFAIINLQQLLAKRLSRKQAFIVASAICIALTIIPIKVADSRASFVALTLLIPYLLFLKAKFKGRIIIISLTILIVISALFTFREKLAWENTRNVRLSIWTSTWSMISEKAFIGFGPGQFEQNFPAYENNNHKEMLVAAHTTQHPHNEILFISSECGLPIALLWCVLVGFSLCQRPQNFIDWATAVGLFILFVQGMMDKPLFQQPTMLLFYILIGLSLSAKYRLNGTFKSPQKLYIKVLAVSLFIIGFAYIYKETAASFYNREAIRAESLKDYNKSYKMTNKSIQHAPWQTMPQYLSFMYAVKNLGQVEKARESHSYLSENAPYFRNFSLIEADYFEQLAQRNPEESPSYLNKAMESYNTACELNSSDVLSYYDRVKFCLRLRPMADLEHAQKATEDLYHRKFLRYLNYFKVDNFKSDIDLWLKGKTYGELLKGANALMNPLKYSKSISPAFPQKYAALMPALGGSLNIGDMRFIMDNISLNKATQSQKNVPEFCNEILSSLQIQQSTEFSWPRETLKIKKGNALSSLCLIASLLHFRQIETAIFQSNQQWYAFCYDEKNFWLIDHFNCKKISLSDFKNTFKTIQAKAFHYPQAYFLKNEFLSHVLAESKIFPRFNRNPAYAMRLFQHHFAHSTNYKISPLEEPFRDLFKKLKANQ